MFKNVASQKIRFYAFIPSTGLPKVGDAANLTAYVSKDRGTLTALTDTSAAEVDATNAQGVYEFDVSQSETNADTVDFTCKSATSDVAIVPHLNLQMLPNRFTTLAIDASGNAGADVNKLGGTAYTAGAIPAAAAGAVGGLPTVDSLNRVKIQSGLSQNVALADFRFVMTDSTNDNPATGKTVTVTRGIDGGAHSAGTLSAVTEVGNGEYRVSFAAADMNGRVISFRATATDCNDLLLDLITDP